MELLIVMMAGLGLMMFFTVRKQKKAQQAQNDLQESLTEGDRVMTTSGLHATVTDTSDDTTIELEIADGFVTTWLRQAVREKIEPFDDDEFDEDDEDVDAVDETEDLAEEKRDEPEVAPSLEHKSK
ncbi:MAG: preprotein translocase subunit YajC [Actinophytocola sp.]|nr:preprotein translocase subunit YajC [Actinophytocola sp.]